MRILFVGDIFGRAGREAVAHFVPKIRAEEQVDLAIGNGENAAGGRGLTAATARDLFEAGLDVITLGNHTWDQAEIADLLKDPRILRPANYPPGLPGAGLGTYRVGDHDVAVLQVMGRHNMESIDCPFRAADALLKTLSTPCVVVDMHAEASSEKQAMGWYLNGRVSAVLGTHTHVQTADDRILPGGTAYLGDAGMSGPRDGVIGGDRTASINRFLTGTRQRFAPAEGDAQFCAALLEIDPATGRAKKIKRIFEILSGKREAVQSR